MTDKKRHFPLTLSSVMTPSPKKLSPGVATPQTATRNAASSAMQHHLKQRLDAVSAVPAIGSSGQRTPLAIPVRMGSEAVRRAMVARLTSQGIKDPRVLDAMQAVPRHLFVPAAFGAQAYIDASLPIGRHQNISQPYIVARMIEVLLDGTALNRVLEIGTGCGYQAAVLAQLAQEVFSIERIQSLHQLAKDNLRHMRLRNLRLQHGDGMLGLPQAGPFDGIILAACAQEVPQALLEQLTIGGRLLAPVAVQAALQTTAHAQLRPVEPAPWPAHLQAQLQHLHLIIRSGKTEWTRQTLEACHFVPLRPGML